MLENILNLEGAQVLSSNEQKEINGGAKNFTTCKCLKAEYDRLFLLGTTPEKALPLKNFIGRYFFELAKCGIF
jgi:hypothetical protein